MGAPAVRIGVAQLGEHGLRVARDQFVQHGPLGCAALLAAERLSGGAGRAFVEATARKYGFTFPVAFDPQWHTLESWLRDASGNTVDTGFTSVTFRLDKQGVVRYVHPGGQYVEGAPAYAEIQGAIERLLAEK